MSPEQREEIKQQLMSGMTQTQIAKKYNLSKQAVSLLNKHHLHLEKEEYGLAKRVRKSLKGSPEVWGRQNWKYATALLQRQGLIFSRKRQNSKKTGYEWSLKRTDIHWPDVCPILGLTLDYFAETRQENSPSFDRIDNTIGYEAGNVQIISWRANRIKNDGTAEEHYKIADFLQHYHCKSSIKNV